ncbi:MAG: monomeric [FeFe] hydrogenase [Candidatus Gastranaerophilales bacterium]|nr:monomeric [FeFe] hydrogenase [Candidatus Gastranaerophilales bacterium]
MGPKNQSIHLKREVLVRMVKAFFSEDFKKNVRLIPYDMRPKGSDVTFRCCIYKERAILKDRIIADLGISIEDDDEKTLLSEYAERALQRETPDENVLTILDAACKGCVGGKILVTELCQGCVARPCETACKFGAISIINGKSVIDEKKCRRCKSCIAICPYNAITNITVPCEDACPVGAIHKNEHGSARIDFDKCISCGKCVTQCPFGAVHEKSQLIDIMKNIKNNKKIVALVAPSIAGQLSGTMFQVKSALMKAGFTDVVEVAKGADVTTLNEAKEFDERISKGEQFMTTSCCAGYNELVKKHIPEIQPYVSDTKTPLFYTAEMVKKQMPDAITVFVSPCVAKRSEARNNPQVDYLINFEEIDALLTGLDINLEDCGSSELDNNISRQGRNYGISGGVAAAVKKASDDEDFVKPCYINGINKESIKQLKKYAKDGLCPYGNLIEVMCCEGGCVGGNATIKSVKSAVQEINDFSKDFKDINEIIR